MPGLSCTQSQFFFISQSEFSMFPLSICGEGHSLVVRGACGHATEMVLITELNEHSCQFSRSSAFLCSKRKRNQCIREKSNQEPGSCDPQEVHSVLSVPRDATRRRNCPARYRRFRSVYNRTKPQYETKRLHPLNPIPYARFKRSQCQPNAFEHMPGKKMPRSCLGVQVKCSHARVA